jgi:hypothetical protein
MVNCSQPYLHESRHKHACRRPRGPGGRFLTAPEIAALKAQQQETQAILQTNISSTTTVKVEQDPTCDFVHMAPHGWSGDNLFVEQTNMSEGESLALHVSRDE